MPTYPLDLNSLHLVPLYQKSSVNAPTHASYTACVQRVAAAQIFLNMPPKTSSQIPALPPPSTPERGSSPELGSPSKITQYNKSTGRPIRKSAGRVKKVAGYVDSALLDEEEFDPLTSDSSTDDGEDDMTSRSRADKSKQKQKRKRSPSPPSPRLEPMIYNQELDELTDDETSDSGHRNTPKKSPVTLQFNVPLGFHGPLFVKLDRALLTVNEEGVRHEMHQAQTKKPRMSNPSPAQPDEAAVTARPKGFADFPPRATQLSLQARLRARWIAQDTPAI